MATAVQKIILSSSRDIPFNKLVLSQSNVRRVKAGISIEDLAASIARRGLIQSLSVVPVVDAEGQETGMFEVPAGGRRFRALELLVKQKRLAKIAPVPCVVRKRDDEVLSEEVSLVENIDRAPLHPLDQFRAFQDMRVKGKTEEEIAAALFVPVQVVKQRLRLAAASPVLLDVYAEDGMTLDQLMAFTVMEGHVGQDLTPGSDESVFSDAERIQTEATEREAAAAAEEAIAADKWPQRVDAALDDGWIVTILIALGAIPLGQMLFKEPMRQYRMGQHLTRMTNIFEEIERTRSSMPIGVGGGVDSLPLARQVRANNEFEQALGYLKIYPRHEVTRELVKNAQLAERMGRPVRVIAIGKLIEVLVQAGAALDMDDFMKSYA